MYPQRARAAPNYSIPSVKQMTQMLNGGSGLDLSPIFDECHEANHDSDERRWRLLFDNMLNGLAYCRVLYDERGRPDDFVFLEVNGAVARLTGLTEVIGRRVTQVIPLVKEQNPELLELIGRVVTTGTPEQAELYFISPGIWLSLSLYRTAPGHFAGTFENITQRKHAESVILMNRTALERRVTERTEQLTQTLKALRLSEERYRGVVEDQTEIITRFLPDGRYTFANEVFCRFFGKLHHEVFDSKWLPQVVSEDLPNIESCLRKLSPTNRSVVIENRVHDAAGNIRWMQFINRGFFNEEGELLETQSVGRDITDHKAAETLLADLNEKLERQVMERTSELTTINTSLTYEIEERLGIEQEILEQQQRLQEMGQELAMTEERERDRIAVDLHDRVSQRLVLARMKVEALGRRIPAVQTAAEGICDLLDQTIQDTRSLTAQIRPPLLAGAGLEAAVQWLGEELHEQYGLRLELCDDHQSKVLEYDIRSTLFQAIRELLVNVAKHAGVSQARVELRREGRQLVITVADAGAGFDLNEAHSRKSRSGGFGLFNIRQKIQYLGGEFQLDSHVGAGTKATIRMPLKGSDAPGDAPGRLKILLVDDQSFVREGLRALIELEADLQVVAEAGSGRAAIALAREQRPDVVIMDLNMPDMNGIDATRIITTELPGVRVVAFSVESDRRFIVEVLKAGASGYVLKDSSFTVLAAAIRTVAGGETYLGPRISEIIIREYLQRVPDFETLCCETLTPREREVLQLIADGKSTKDISFALEISGKTVDGQRHSLMTKLDLYSTAELTKYAIREGLTSRS